MKLIGYFMPSEQPASIQMADAPDLEDAIARMEAKGKRIEIHQPSDRLHSYVGIVGTPHERSHPVNRPELRGDIAETVLREFLQTELRKTGE